MLGIGSGEHFSLLGRKKVMILAITPDTPENYTNLQIFYDMVGINKLEYKQTGDFKALNLLLGLMSCSSLCGCCYCEAKRSSDEWSDGGARPRSMNSLSENTDNFKKIGGGDRLKAKHISANSVEKPIVFDSEDDGSIPVFAISNRSPRKGMVKMENAEGEKDYKKVLEKFREYCRP